MATFNEDLQELELKIYRTKAALLREVNELEKRIEELYPACRYAAQAKVDGLRRRVQ